MSFLFEAPERQSLIKAELVDKYFGAWARVILEQDDEIPVLPSSISSPVPEPIGAELPLPRCSFSIGS